MHEFAPGLFVLPSRAVNAYVLTNPDGTLTMLDTGLPNRFEHLRAGLASSGRTPADVTGVVLTHHHGDHAGNVAALREAARIRVYAPALDAPVVRGDAPPQAPDPGGALGAVLKVLAPLVPKAAPTPVDVEVQPDDVVPLGSGLRAVATPGHTPGHTSYLLDEAGGVLFVGDAAASSIKRGRAAVTKGFVNPRTPEVLASVRTLAALEFRHAVFGHGPILDQQPTSAFRRYLDREAARS